VNREDNIVLVKLNTKLYKLDSILKVAQAFTGACKVDVGGDAESSVQVKLKPKSKNIQINKVGLEFLNHVLADMKIDEDL